MIVCWLVKRRSNWISLELGKTCAGPDIGSSYGTFSVWVAEDLDDLETTSDAILSNLSLVVNSNRALAVIGVAAMFWKACIWSLNKGGD